jgi:hypothetical protein
MLLKLIQLIDYSLGHLLSLSIAYNRPSIPPTRTHMITWLSKIANFFIHKTTTVTSALGTITPNCTF